MNLRILNNHSPVHTEKRTILVLKRPDPAELDGEGVERLGSDVSHIECRQESDRALNPKAPHQTFLQTQSDLEVQH